MEEAIRNFPKQFDFEPVIENKERLVKKEKVILAGMGGSHLGAWLLKRHNPNLDLLIHRDYGLPRVPDYFLNESLIILSSYSGNTEEVLDVGKLALERGLSLCAMASGGALIDFAKANNLPYIVLPNTGIEPRMALGFAMIAIASLTQDSALEASIKNAGKSIDPLLNKENGENLAKQLLNKKPIVYSSTLNLPITYCWKIKFNETGKIPSSFNVFPELCHNELSGYDVVENTASLLKDSHVIMLKDDEDEPRILKRMNILQDLFSQRGVPTSEIMLTGNSALEKIYNSILFAEWVALTIAHNYNVPDAKTPLIAQFKLKMAE